MINREESFILIKKYLKDRDNIRTSIAVESLLKEIAQKIEKDPQLWGLTGLLHNIDYEYTSTNPENRGTLSSQILDGLLPETSINAIKAINYTHTDYIPVTSLDKALIASTTIIGLILAIIPETPNKDINQLDLQFLFEKFNNKDYATRFNRSRIELCQDFGFNIESFLKLSLDTMKKISQTIGL
jgi:hypothetical protein